MEGVFYEVNGRQEDRIVRGEGRRGEEIIKEEEISREEIKRTIKDLKAMGVDGILNEVWKYGGGGIGGLDKEIL